MEVIQLPETLPRLKKRTEPPTKHNNFSEWLSSIEEKIRKEFD
jgi:hypothetical protein